MWDFLRQVLALFQDATRSTAQTCRLAVLLCLLIAIIWVLSKLIQ